MASSAVASASSPPPLHCALCLAAPSSSASSDDAKAVAKLLTCGGCGIARYCGRQHQKEHWKTHKLTCSRTHQTDTTTNTQQHRRTHTQAEDGEKTEEREEKEMVTTAPSSPPAVFEAKSKSMAQMQTEREAALRSAYSASSEQSAAFASSVIPTSPSSSSSPSLLDVSSFPPWVDLLWGRIRHLVTSADVDIEHGRADSAVLSLTTALHLHAALPPDYPRSVLHNILGYRSVAYLKLATPLPQLAVWDAVTSVKVHRDYLHAYGLLHNAWKAFGNEKKAWEAAELGRKSAEERGDNTLTQRFVDMKAALAKGVDERNTAAAKPAKKGGAKKGKGGEATAAALTGVEVEVRGLHAAQQSRGSDYDLSLYQDAVQRSLTNDLGYHIPHLTTLPSSFSLFYPTSTTPADLARDQPLYSSLCQGKPFEVAYTPQLGRHLVATRAIRAGELVLNEKPMYASTYCEDVCTNCWKSLSREDGVVVGAVKCVARCGHEWYCSVACRDERWPQHEFICGHSWRELRERRGVTTSSLIWLMMPLILNDAMRHIKAREKDIRMAAIRASLAQQPMSNAHSSSGSSESGGGAESSAAAAASPSPASSSVSSDSPLSAGWDVLSCLPLRHLLSHQELPAAYANHATHDFDRMWAMSTLLSHWFVVTPPHSAHDTSGTPPQPTIASAASLSFLPHLTYTLYEHCITRLLLNSHALHSSAAKAAAARGGGGRPADFIAVGLLSSLFNHSCFPNCHLNDDGQQAAGRLIVHASRAIKKGEALTLAYCDVRGSRLERAERLFHYGFACACSRCSREKGQERQLAEFYASMHITAPPHTAASS